MSGARGRGQLSEMTKIISSDRVLEPGEANETIRWGLGPREGGPEGSGRTQEQLALLTSISRNGTTTLGESRSGTRVDCWMQQGRQHEDEWKLNTDVCAILHSRER